MEQRIPATLAQPADLGRVLSKLELWVGAAVTALGVLLLLIWRTGRADDRHGMAFVFLAGAFVLPLGLTLLLAASVLRRGGSRRWLAQLIPALWPVLYVVLFRWLLLP